MEPVLARKMWRTLEAFHGFIYFSKDAADAYGALGLKPAAGYFASRSAPMGPVPAEVVIATFFNFFPGFVTDAMDGAWDAASPTDVHAARMGAVDVGLRRVLGGAIDSPEVADALTLARTAAEGCTVAGRPLYAGLASVPWPEEPHLQLWLAISLVREFRGDGHIAALVAEGVSALEALHVHGASGEVPASILKLTRAWPDDQWDAAGADMADRGLLDAAGALTEAGAALRQRIEDTTDRLALAPWEHLGPDGSDRLRALVRPWSKAIVESGSLGFR